MARNQRRDREDKQESDVVDKLVSINRVAKVVKGGRRFGFAALVVVGDQKGRVGFGSGKAREVPEAIRKGTEQAKRTMIRVPLREGRTLHHDVKARYGAGKVVLRAAPPGTGIIAGGPMRAVFEAAPPENTRMQHEPNGSKICRGLGLTGLQHYSGTKKRGIHHYDSEVFPCIATAVVKGLWNISEYPEEMAKVIQEFKIDVKLRGWR